METRLPGLLGCYVETEAYGELIAMDVGAFDGSAVDFVVLAPPVSLLLHGVLAAADRHRALLGFVADDVVGVVFRGGAFVVAPLEKLGEILGKL